MSIAERLFALMSRIFVFTSSRKFISIVGIPKVSKAQRTTAAVCLAVSDKNAFL
jgi:hypothetical protein